MSGIDIKPLIGVTTPDLQGFFSVYSKIDQLLGQFEYIEPVDGEEPYYKLTVEDWLALKTGIEYFRSCEELLDENLAKNFHLISRLEMLARMLGEGQIHIGSAAREIADQANTVRFNNAPTVCVSSLLYALGCNMHEVDNVHRLFFKDGDASIMDCVRMSVRTDISDPDDVTYMSPGKNVRMCGGGSRSGGSNDTNISLMFSSADGKSFVTIRRLADMSKNIKENCCNRFYVTYHEDVDFPGKSVHYVYHMEDMWDTFEDTFNPTPEEIAVWDLAHPDDPFVHLAGDKTPNVLIRSPNPRARPPPLPGAEERNQGDSGEEDRVLPLPPLVLASSTPAPRPAVSPKYTSKCHSHCINAYTV